MFRPFSTTVNTTVKKTICLFIAVLLLTLSGCGERAQSDYPEVIYSNNYAMTDESVINPFMGFAVDATSKTAASEYSLVYIDITFRELQPESPDTFNFEEITENNNIDLWKSQGKHAVLRFVCDVPSDQVHKDIPDWLYDLTADGTFYDTSYGKGYSPDYNNEIFIKYHKQAVAALADYFADGFVAFVELGSLGHWGEWHVKREDGIVPMPNAEVRDEYVRHYIEAFNTVKLMMRRPFESASYYKLGLFNDMAGDPEATEEWVYWINNGGEYTQTGEKNALSAMPVFWKTSPCGGELTSSLSMEYLCSDGLENTLELIKDTHTTFLGPKCPVSSSDKYDSEIYKNAATEMIRALGYRIGISRVEVKKTSEDGSYIICMEWENNGTAPLYYDLPVKLFLTESNGNIKSLADVDIKLSELLPGERITSETKIVLDADSSEIDILLGIIDPMTGNPSVKLVSDQVCVNNLMKLFQYDADSNNFFKMVNNLKNHKGA